MCWFRPDTASGALDQPASSRAPGFPGAIWIKEDQQLHDELVVGQLAEGVLVQAAAGWPPGEVAECVDLPPREPRLAELATASSSVGAGRTPPNRSPMRARVRRVAASISRASTGSASRKVGTRLLQPHRA